MSRYQLLKILELIISYILGNNIYNNFFAYIYYRRCASHKCVSITGKCIFGVPVSPPTNSLCLLYNQQVHFIFLLLYHRNVPACEMSFSNNILYIFIMCGCPKGDPSQQIHLGPEVFRQWRNFQASVHHHNGLETKINMRYYSFWFISNGLNKNIALMVYKRQKIEQHCAILPPR